MSQHEPDLMNSNWNFTLTVYVIESKTISIYHTTLAQSIHLISFIETVRNLLAQASIKTAKTVLVPRGRAPFSQHQESRSLGEVQHRKSAIHELSANLRIFRVRSDNLICWENETITPRKLRNLHQKPRFVMLIKRSAAPGDENVIDPLGHNTYMYDKVSQYNTLTSPPVTSVLRNPASCATFFFSFSILTLNNWNKSKQHQNLEVWYLMKRKQKESIL